MKIILGWFGLALLLYMGLPGCKPTTTSQKIEDKAEDAAHETKQSLERAGEKIKDATK